MLIKIVDFEFTEVWDWSEKVYRLIESSGVKTKADDFSSAFCV